VKRCGRLSVGRSRVRVASAVDGIAVEEIAVAGTAAGVIVVAVTRVRARLLVRVNLVGVIRGWILCGNGLHRVVLGRVRRMMRLSI
jgi:hypothetical protein